MDGNSETSGLLDDYIVYATPNKLRGIKLKPGWVLRDVFQKIADTESKRTDIEYVHGIRAGSFNCCIVFNVPDIKVAFSAARTMKLSFEPLNVVWSRRNSNPTIDIGAEVAKTR